MNSAMRLTAHERAHPPWQPDGRPERKRHPNAPPASAGRRFSGAKEQESHRLRRRLPQELPREPVEILDTDDARTRELKAAVQETKEEPRRRMAAGEDVAKAMNDALDECRRLARYRRELQERLCEIRADAGAYDEREVEDFTKAANELLARERMPPLTTPRTVMRGLLRR